MNLNKENGITIIALIITIILMLILAGVGMHFGNRAIDKAKLEDIKTDMLSIKTKALVIAEKYNFKDIEDLVGTSITNEEANKLGITNNDNVRKWSKEDLNNQGLTTIDGNIYIVNYSTDGNNTCEVYYLNGYQGKYSLTELQGI